jgi:hypothetical protein
MIQCGLRVEGTVVINGISTSQRDHIILVFNIEKRNFVILRK